MQAIRELDNNDADVVRHRHEHFADVFRLIFFAGGKMDFGNFRDAFDKLRHFRPEHFFKLIVCHAAVFADIVEQSGGNGDGIHFHVR